MNDRLKQLLELVKEQKAGAEDYREIAKLIREDQGNELLSQLDAFHLEAINTPVTENYDAAHWQPIINTVLEADKLQSPVPAERTVHALRGNRKTVRFQWWSAAAVLLIVVGAGWWWMSTLQQTDTGKKPVAATNTSGGMKLGAVLTLSDGRTIQLDSVMNGVLAGDAGSVLEKSNGQLNYQQNGDAPIVHNHISTPRGRKYQVILPDGTKVWLNAASRLTYPTAFKGERREVELMGEAFFDVAKNQQQPFIVKVNDLSIQVLGTSFDINAYPEQIWIRTTLAEGAVQANANGQSLTLIPGEQARYNAAKNSLSKQKVDVDLNTAWLKGLIYFYDEPFPNIAANLERTFDYDFVFDAATLKDIHLTIELNDNRSLQDVLEGISLISDLRFTIEGKAVHVRKN